MNVKPFLYRYPVFVNGRHPKNKRVRGAVLVKEIEIAVPVLSGYEAQVAAAIRIPIELMGRQTMVMNEFRHYEGAFYTMSQMHPSDLEDAFANPFASHGNGRRLVWEVASKTREFPCWPKDIQEQFNDPGAKLPSGDLCVRESSSIILEPGQEDILISQQARAETISGYFVVIDGRVWERSPEPAYSLKASDRKVSVDARDTYGYRSTKVGIHAGDARFSLLDRDGAANVFSTYYAGYTTSWPDVEITMPDAFQTDYTSVNFAEFARCLADNFNTYNSGRGPIGERISLLKRLTKDVVFDELDFDAVEGVVVQLLADHGRHGIFRDVEERAIKQHMELWDSRPVELQRFQPFAPTP